VSEPHLNDNGANSERPLVAAIIDDLYFMSILSTAARHLDVPLAFPKPSQPISEDTALVVVDLDCRRDWEEQIAPFVRAGGVAIAFGPHVDAEKRRRAKAAGCRRVLAKSRFVTEVGAILSSAFDYSDRSRRSELAADPAMVGDEG
jgi:hypothetical protein